MKLTQYLEAKNLSPEQFARIAGFSESGVKKWIYAERVPRPEQMRRISEVTEGSVQPNDFVLTK